MTIPTEIKKKKAPTAERANALIGQRFGQLVVMKSLGCQYPKPTSTYKRFMVLCKCDCGAECAIELHAIESGGRGRCDDCKRVKGRELAQIRERAKTKAKLNQTGVVVSTYSTEKMVSSVDLSNARLQIIWTKLDKSDCCIAWQDCEKFCAWALRNGFCNSKQLQKRDPNKPHHPLNSFWK